jgi:hypothetical protein
MAGKSYRSGPLPLSFQVMDIARSWGIPPWAVSTDTPTDDVRRRWLVLTMIRNRMGV